MVKLMEDLDPAVIARLQENRFSFYHVRPFGRIVTTPFPTQGSMYVDLDTLALTLKVLSSPSASRAIAILSNISAAYLTPKS